MFKRSIVAHYYDIKYPYLQYSYPDGIMCSVPPKLLAVLYKKHYGKRPKTFFDCGAATGVVIKLAMDAHGVDVRDYSKEPWYSNPWFGCNPVWVRQCDKPKGYAVSDLAKLVTDGRIQIKSILDCEPVKADLVYCNGILTYFDLATLPRIIAKFQNVNMLCAIHNTTEDYIAAEKIGQNLGTCQALKTVQSNDWWIDTFTKNGFDTKFNHWLRCFVAIPSKGK